MKITKISDAKHRMPAPAIAAGEPAARADITAVARQLVSSRCRPDSAFALRLLRACHGMAPIGRDRVPREGILARFNRTLLWSFILVAAWFGSAYRGTAQSTNQLPVYYVNQFGVTAAQARVLADSFHIPPGQLLVSNGLALFIDPSNYLAIPTLPVTNAAALNLLLGQTQNQAPAIPIQAQQIDFGALSNLAAYDSGLALQVTSNGLASAGLTPQFGAPTTGHTMFTAVYSNENNTVMSNRVALDTEVEYQFTLPGGYPLEGPGAQVQLAYGASGNVTRLLYAAPQLSPGPMVQTISMADALARAANLMDPTHVLGPLNLTGTWVYRMPFCLPCVKVEGPVYVPPWVKVEGSVLETNELTGEVSTLHLMPQYIPGTDDPAFVPQVNLMVSTVGNTQVVASVAVTNGTPPYTYVWSGSSASATGNNGPAIGYAPIVRATPPPLELEFVVALHQVLLHWWAPDPNPWANEPVPNPWVLESSADLTRGASGWTAVTNPVVTSNGVNSVLVDMGAPSQFFRLRLAVPTAQTFETVAVTVTDANGLSVQTSQTVPVQALVVAVDPIYLGLPPQLVDIIDWGTESPYDPGLGTGDRNDWRSGMFVGGGGLERFLWTGATSWKEDFLNPPFGIAPYEVNDADITLYIGHGNPTVFTFTGGPGPNPTTLFFNDPGASWGSFDEQWLGLLSCEVLANDWNGLTAWQRWGPNFNGLHSLLGFSSLAYAGTGFPFTFATSMLGWPPFPLLPFGQPIPIVNAWFNAAHARGTGTPAAMGPIGPGGVCDFGDYYWAKGPVGPTIFNYQFTGSWYLSY